MKQQQTANVLSGEVSAEGEARLAGAYFPCDTAEFEKGDAVSAVVGFSDVELTDDEDEGQAGGNIINSIYKGTYYFVQVRTDEDEYFYVDTPYEWDLNDRVGIKIAPEKIRLTAPAPDADGGADGKDAVVSEGGGI
jgi:spermidine/putrescine transport system ATP-binding protein